MKEPLSPGRHRHMLAEARPVAPDILVIKARQASAHLIVRIELLRANDDPQNPLLALVTAEDHSVDLLFATGPLCGRFAAGEKRGFFKAEVTDGAIEIGERVSGWR